MIKLKIHKDSINNKLSMDKINRILRNLISVIQSKKIINNQMQIIKVTKKIKITINKFHIFRNQFLLLKSKSNFNLDKTNDQKLINNKRISKSKKYKIQELIKQLIMIQLNHKGNNYRILKLIFKKTKLTVIKVNRKNKFKIKKIRHYHSQII